MPTVLRAEGAKLYFTSREPNEPAHIHVDRGGASAKMWLDPVVLASNSGFAAHELGGLLRLVRERQVELPEAWHGLFGTG